MKKFLRQIIGLVSRSKKIDFLKDLPYEFRYNNLNLIEFIENIPLIESQIVEDIYEMALTFYNEKGCFASGDILKFKENNYRFALSFPPKTRTLSIHFLNIIPTKNKVRTTTINEIGLIRKIEFHYSIEAESICNLLIEFIKDILKTAYLSIEKKFITEYKSVRELLFDNLYNIVNTEIERQNRKKLLGKTFFTITRRDSVLFRYFFDLDYAKLIISHYKKNQVADFSPLELIISLLSEEATHTMNLLMEADIGELLFLSSSKFKSIEENYRFWKSEAHYLDYKEISAFTIYKNDKIILQISTKRELEADFLIIYNNVKDLIKECFENNIQYYYKYALSLKKIPKPQLTATSSEEIAKFLGTLVGKTASEYFN